MYTHTHVHIHMYIHIHNIYIYIYIHTHGRAASESLPQRPMCGRGDDTVGKPHRARISQFELFELVLLMRFRQAILYRAIRADSISVNSILPPS